ncbi:unnamed protein product [Parnassius apollo]|uniref:(apollo) hypothetical protein n=1 Tax=Parnassius apollo TaxID=110799 RepID=A0A8S3WDN7_PARAO|nr:unnamed protein product [Parnassius apollo]
MDYATNCGGNQSHMPFLLGRMADKAAVHMISGPLTSRQNTMPQIQPQILDTPIIPLEEQLQSPPTPQTMLRSYA